MPSKLRFKCAEHRNVVNLFPEDHLHIYIRNKNAGSDSHNLDEYMPRELMIIGELKSNHAYLFSEKHINMCKESAGNDSHTLDAHLCIHVHLHTHMAIAIHTHSYASHM